LALAGVGPRLARDGARSGARLARAGRREEPHDAVALADRGAPRAGATLDLDDRAPRAIQDAHAARGALVAVAREPARRALSHPNAAQDEPRGARRARAGADLGRAGQRDADAVAAAAPRRVHAPDRRRALGGGLLAGRR